jgi:hypothetical protein
MERPSWKELTYKIKNAVELVSIRKIKILDPIVIASDAIELDYHVKDLQSTLLAIMDEIGPENYEGTRPPQKSYKVEIRDAELFAFSWPSKLFGCKTYVKYCFYLVSLHRDRKEKGD